MQGTGEQEAQISCTSEECLDAWPLVTTQGEPLAGEGANGDMLGTPRQEGRTVVTYNGWQLYYFARDEGPTLPRARTSDLSVASGTSSRPKVMSFPQSEGRAGIGAPALNRDRFFPSLRICGGPPPALRVSPAMLPKNVARPPARCPEGTWRRAG